MAQKLATPPAHSKNNFINSEKSNGGSVHTFTHGAAAKKMDVKNTSAHSTAESTAYDLAEQRRLAKEKAEKRAQSRTLAKRQQAAERIASATEELASGVAESNAAADQLSSAMDQIESGAVQASAAAQESQTVAQLLQKNAEINSAAATQSLRKINNIQVLVRSTSADIDKLISTVGVAAEKNVESARMVADLEKQANEIGNVVKTVAGIADQTNLLALNAAIEAARAGEHGRGFAVVADEVRNLAEVAEKSARDIAELIGNISRDVNVIAKDTEVAGVTAKEEVEKGKAITKQLVQLETDLGIVQQGTNTINENSMQMATAVDQFKKGAEVIATAAEEASAAAQEAATTCSEQKKALKDIEGSTDELAQMAEELKHSTDSEKSSQGLAAAAEELSATVQQANASAQQIMSAIRQIAKGSEQQGAATQQSSTALKQIEASTRDIDEKATASLSKVNALKGLLAENKTGIDFLIEGIGKAAKASKFSGQNVIALQQRIRQIDKIVDAITNTATKTDMLAVNGGIEAARAGDFGKGFAVVAGDIRSLATDSATNAEKIKDMVRGIQDKIQVVAKDIIEVGEAAEREVQTAKKSTENLNIIENDMNEVQKGVNGIQVATQESVVSIAQAQKGVEQIASAAQQASSAAQQASSSANQQAKGMQELAKAIEDIAALADDLQNNA